MIEDLNEDDDSELEGSVEESEETSVTSASVDEIPWITWFLGLRGNDFFCAIDDDYIGDDFNLTGLSSMVPCYENALEMITDIDVSLGTELRDLIQLTFCLILRILYR